MSDQVQEEQRWSLVEEDFGGLFDDEISLGSSLSFPGLVNDMILSSKGGDDDDVKDVVPSFLTAVGIEAAAAVAPEITVFSEIDVNEGSNVNVIRTDEDEEKKGEKPTAIFDASRLVSVDGIMDMEKAGSKKIKELSTKTTPYESLKELVKKKNNRNSTKAAAAASTTAKSVVHSVSLHSFDDVKTTSPSFLGQEQPAFSSSYSDTTFSYNDNDTSYSCEHRKLVAGTQRHNDDLVRQRSLLHRACSRSKDASFGKLIKSILIADPKAAERSEAVKTDKMVYDAKTHKLKLRATRETYTYPLNIAIQHSAGVDVIEKLVQAAPAVTALPDGTQRECSLSIFIKHRPDDVNIIDMMMLKNPNCASFTDRHNNTALHVACMYGACLETVRHLCALYPKALTIRNFNGLTPLQLAQQKTSACSNDVASFLFRRQQAGN